MPKLVKDTTPLTLRPYRAHGVDVTGYQEGMTNLETDCPFCGKEGKFGIKVSDGRWQCWSCHASDDGKKDGGNAYSFIRLVWNRSFEETSVEEYQQLAEQRGFLYPDTLIRWGLARSFLSGDWLMPGYNAKFHLIQLYRYVEHVGKRLLKPTPEVGEEGHRTGIFGLQNWSDAREIVDVFESWNGIAFDEVINQSDGWGSSNRNVIAIPGASIFHADWFELFRGKIVNLWGDNDHPKIDPKSGKDNGRASYRYNLGRADKLVGVAKQVNVLAWGPDGYDPALDSGFDVRDLLKSRGSLEERSEALRGLVPKFKTEAVSTKYGGSTEASDAVDKLTSVRCESWDELIAAWKKALRWRQDLDDTLSVMLAVALSTEQVGDQLFLMVLGNAGSAKSTLCDAMLTSWNCYAFEHLTGFHSGWKGDDSKGYSLLDKIDRKTLITSEGDVLMSNPRFHEIMSQQRRIFDGKSNASFKNMKEDQSYEGLRTPWIIAGTFALLDTDQAKLGDRFLKCVIEDPATSERNEILKQVARTAAEEVRVRSTKKASGQMSKSRMNAFRMTGGYVDYLRANAELLEDVEIDDRTYEMFAAYGEFVALLRARPLSPQKKRDKFDENDTKEMPTRLTKQFVRLGLCIAVVLQKTEVDEECVRRVQRVVMSTARGIIFKLIEALYALGYEGGTTGGLSHDVGLEYGKVRALLSFMKTLNVVEAFVPTSETKVKQGHRWRLSSHMKNLYEEVINERN